MTANPFVFAHGQNTPLQLGALLGSGGEGAVYECATDRSRLVKVFHQLDSFRQAKLKAMVAMPALMAYPRLAWPQSLVVDRAGRVSGYVMRKLKGVSLVPLTAPVLRAKRLPHWKKAHTARVVHELASLFGLLESNGVYIADLNLCNFVVSNDGEVSAFDCDAFSVLTATHRFPATVVSAEHQVAEILSGALDLNHFGPAQFRGAAALLFFSLLTEGGQPYATYEGLSVADAIVQGRYAVGGKEARGHMPHEVFRRYVALGPRLCVLFKRSFIAGHANPNARPTFAEWQSALRAHYAELLTQN